jgi:hypothetical protein
LKTDWSWRGERLLCWDLGEGGKRGNWACWGDSRGQPAQVHRHLRPRSNNLCLLRRWRGCINWLRSGRKRLHHRGWRSLHHGRWWRRLNHGMWWGKLRGRSWSWSDRNWVRGLDRLHWLELHMLVLEGLRSGVK